VVGHGDRRAVHAHVAFVADTVPTTRRRIDELLAKARAADAEVARIANGPVMPGRPIRTSTWEDEDDDPPSDHQFRAGGHQDVRTIA